MDGPLARVSGLGIVRNRPPQYIFWVDSQVIKRDTNHHQPPIAKANGVLLK